jgi:osmotically-inducible protein OsmY
MKPQVPVLLCLGLLACSHEKRPESAYATQGARTYSSPMLASEPDEPLTPASGVGEARPTSDEAARDTGSDMATNNAGINQGETEADMALSLRVREALLSDPNLSFIAKSITIISRDGRVTLRGLVNTQQERTLVERIALQIGPVVQVENDLGVASE